MDRVTREPCDKGTNLHRNHRNMIISISYDHYQVFLYHAGA